MSVLRLRTVEGFIAFDLDDSPINAGGTRFAPDVSEHETVVLARAMTYKFAVLGIPTGGAKGAVRGGPGERKILMARYCDEIRPLVDSRRFLTGPDLGTFDADFAPLWKTGELPGAMSRPMEGGVSFEDVLTGFGVVVAAARVLGSLEGRTLAVEGFGKVGGGVAREATRRGARVVAVSTLAGCIHDPRGLDVAELWMHRAERGDDFVRDLGLEVLPPEALFDLECDVLVPGARTGVVDAERASRLAVRVVAPAANVPYAAGAIERLRERGIPALADFVCNAGAVIGYLSPRASTHDEILADVETRIAALVGETMEHPGGPFAGACAVAERFLRTWRDERGLPPGPPVA